MKKKLELHWFGLYTLKSINNLPNEIRQGGIYICGFMNNEKFIPHYVGKANKDTKILYRIYDYISNIKSGYCTIWDMKSKFIIPPYNDQETRIEKTLFFPPINVPGDDNQIKKEYPKKFDYSEVLSNWDKYKPQIEFMQDHFAFGFANCHDEDISDAEKRIINLIGKDNLTNIRGGETSLKINHTGVKNITELFIKKPS